MWSFTFEKFHTTKLILTLGKKIHLCFDFVADNHGEQFRFCLVSFVSEVADQIQLVRAFAAHDFGQIIPLSHLKKTMKLILKSSYEGTIMYGPCSTILKGPRGRRHRPLAQPKVHESVL
jgi:hypothetical protein